MAIQARGNHYGLTAHPHILAKLSLTHAGLDQSLKVIPQGLDHSPDTETGDILAAGHIDPLEVGEETAVARCEVAEGGVGNQGLTATAVAKG